MRNAGSLAEFFARFDVVTKLGRTLVSPPFDKASCYIQRARHDALFGAHDFCCSNFSHMHHLLVMTAVLLRGKLKIMVASSHHLDELSYKHDVAHRSLPQMMMLY
jgi:hypothetical protein